jgi:hypothetical protein
LNILKSSREHFSAMRQLFMTKKPRPPASIGAKFPTLGEQFGRLEDRIQKIGGQPLPRLKNPKAK